MTTTTLSFCGFLLPDDGQYHLPQEIRIQSDCLVGIGREPQNTVVLTIPTTRELADKIPLISILYAPLNPFSFGYQYLFRSGRILFLVSRKHATLKLEGGNLLLADLESFNGTFIDGVRIRPNEPQILHLGAWVL